MAVLKQVPATCTTPHRAALESVRAEMKTRFIERDEIVDMMFVALVARCHLFMIGPPGVAKSALVNAMTGYLDGARLFQITMNRFTVPEELFGPISLAALQQDRVARISTGKLPEADLAFLDETMQGSSAILNALLTLMNERVFFNDGKAVPCPLQTLVGASNSLGESNELEALFDRFMIRVVVNPVTEPRSIRRLLTASPIAASASMTLDDLGTCQREAAQVAVPDGVIDGIIGIRQRAEAAGLRASDRRWRQLVDVLTAKAYVEGDDVVSEDHLEILPDCLWREPRDRPALAAIVGAVANPLAVRAIEVLDAAKEAVAALGPMDAKDANAKAEWLRSASLIESRLSDMSTELSSMVGSNPKRNVRRARATIAAIAEMKTDVTRRVATLYRL